MDGQVYCWGSNTAHQVGQRRPGAVLRPRRVEGIEGVVQVVTGTMHSCALTAGGTVWCWGSNAQGALGPRTGGDTWQPTSVSGLNSIRQLSANRGTNCALDSSGVVYCWGHNGPYIVVPSGRPLGEPVPRVISGLAPAVEVVVGDLMACTRTVYHQIQCWGIGSMSILEASSNRQAGTTPTFEPRQIEGVTPASTLTRVGLNHCAIVRGELRCWGHDNRPLASPDLSAWIAIPVPSIGGTPQHSGGCLCALRHPTSLLCWRSSIGGNIRLLADAGWLDQQQSSPQILGIVLDEATLAVAFSDDFACLLTETHSVRCWGNNSLGQLGDGTTESRNTPVRLQF
ncbi:MAG: hypothetical protein HY909_23255 [Deltaproteobacteria bacterium]|nr:hypothetical protein [Deltaproteobacteria bacterium]